MENKTISSENVELKRTLKKLKESSEMNEIKANNLEKLLYLKEDEISTLMSSLLQSDKENQNLIQKFSSEKGELELIIEELQNVKINIQNNMKKNSNQISLTSPEDDENKALRKIAEEKDTRKKDDEIEKQIDVLTEKVHERDFIVNRLQEEKQKHEIQLKRLHGALKTSFEHIRSLRRAIEESQHIQSLDVDNLSLEQLLCSTRNMPGSSLHSLKLSLFDLKEKVGELNTQLDSTSSERETPSFLDKLQDISDSVGETSSLQLSAHSSLNSSPAHFIT